ncbi:MAG: hypothetical protein WDA20_12090, partial [Desulfuromonadales bacterium]
MKIDKKPAGGRSPRRRYLWTLLLLTPLVLLLLWRAGVLTPAIAVQLVTVSRIHPSQSLTVLNASG